MLKNFGQNIYKNLPNIVSIFGLLPLVLLFSEQGYQYLIPLIVYNNIMDDLDGILAAKLDLKSKFGGRLDNVCDALSHGIFVMVIGMHYGLLCGIAGLFAVVAILIRVVYRLGPGHHENTGSPTNELIRHLFFAILLTELFHFDPTVLLIMIFLINSVSLLMPYPMPYMIRSQAKATASIVLVNIILILAWLIPSVLPIIAGCFMLTYLYSFKIFFVSFKKAIAQ